MIHQVVSAKWVFRMGSTILEHPVFIVLKENMLSYNTYTVGLNNDCRQNK